MSEGKGKGRGMMKRLARRGREEEMKEGTETRRGRKGGGKN